MSGSAIRDQLGDRAVCHLSEQSTFILNIYLVSA